MASDEALSLKLFVFQPVLDAEHTHRRRAIIGQLEDAAEQNRHVLEFDAGPLLDLGNDEMG